MPSDLRTRAEAVLRALAGETARLRDDQWQAIDALVRGRSRVLVVQRTGWGKSAVYFVATSLLRADGAGPTVIVSPLLALMRNQIAAAEKAGIRAVTINSTNLEQWDQIIDSVRAGEVDVLLVSPERLNNPDFRDNVLPKLAADTGLLVVDEAHCISDWGHDFRPDYRRLRQLIAELPTGVPVLATTATANSRVVTDVASQLDIGGDSMVLRGPLDRESLHLSVVNQPSAAHRLGWLSEHLDALPGSGIIYTLTVAATEEVADFLRERGHRVLAYSGRTDVAEREAAEQALLGNEVKALVATSALGMGFDKPDLGFVVHLGAPPSPVAYYQQIGRAGRSTARADVVLLPGAEDRDIWRYFASLAFPPEDQVNTVLSALSRSERPLSTAALETAVDLRRTRLEMMLKVLDADGAVRRVRGGWIFTGQPWTYDTERYARLAEIRSVEQQAMLDYATTGECRMEFLRRQLDDPDAVRCGRCDNCTGTSVAGTVSDTALSAAAGQLEKIGVVVEPRAMWPSAMKALGVGLSGKIPAMEQAEPGRALARLSDIGWGTRLRALFTADDAPVPDDVLQAVVRVLADWNWDRRPQAVVGMPSAGRPRLAGSLAEGIARIGRLPSPGGIVRTRESGGGQANSAQRLAAVHNAFALDPALTAWLSEQDSPVVLLVDDRADTRWTLTVVARQLRLAGAGAVLPLVLATEA